MKKGFLFLMVIIMISGIFVVLARTKIEGGAELVIYNANVVTFDEEQERAEAIVVRGGKIEYVGSNEAALMYVDKTTKMMDLKGATVLPGFIDSHMHLTSLGASLSKLNLVGTTSKQQILGLIGEEAKKLKENEWLLGRGWDQNDWDVKEFPTARDLDSVVKDKPVCLTRIDGHAIWVNSKAMELAKIDDKTAAPEGGRIIRDKRSNKPTGIFIDNAEELITRAIPRVSKEQLRINVLKGMEECVRNGLTMVNDAGAVLDEIEIYKELKEQNKLMLRLYVMISDDDNTLKYYKGKGPELGTKDYMLMIRAIKLYADGAMGSSGAAFFEPYVDDPSNKGLFLIRKERLDNMVKLADSDNWQLCTHAIGDRAIYLTLDAYAKGKRTKEARHRIEHAQVVRLADIVLFAKYNIIASMQPIHATSDMYWAEDRVGKERLKGAYAWRSFINGGVRVAGGSDAPVESVNPLLGIYASVTRKDLKGYPQGGWMPDQKLNIMEAVKLYTKDAAYASFMEKIKGVIKKGYLADFTILDKDITTIEFRQIPKIKVLNTIVGGKIVY